MPSYVEDKGVDTVEVPTGKCTMTAGAWFDKACTHNEALGKPLSGEARDVALRCFRCPVNFGEYALVSYVHSWCLG